MQVEVYLVVRCTLRVQPSVQHIRRYVYSVYLEGVKRLISWTVPTQYLKGCYPFLCVLVALVWERSRTRINKLFSVSGRTSKLIGSRDQFGSSDCSEIKRWMVFLIYSSFQNPWLGQTGKGKWNVFIWHILSLWHLATHCHSGPLEEVLSFLSHSRRGMSEASVLQVPWLHHGCHCFLSSSLRAVTLNQDSSGVGEEVHSSVAPRGSWRTNERKSYWGLLPQVPLHVFFWSQHLAWLPNPMLYLHPMITVAKACTRQKGMSKVKL